MLIQSTQTNGDHMLMMIKKLQRSLFIALLLQTCLPVFSQPSQQSSIVKEQNVQNRDTFETNMLQSRSHTQAIGFAIQQILQTIDAGKVKVPKTKKPEIVIQLAQLLEQTRSMLETIYVQNTQQALVDSIILNNAIMSHLIETLKTDLSNLSLDKITQNIRKKSPTTIPDELVQSMLKKNELNKEKLIYAADHLGITWVNALYRTMKKNNVYYVAKAGVIGCATLAITGLLLCTMSSALPEAISDSSVFRKYIGKRPLYNSASDSYYHMIKFDRDGNVKPEKPLTWENSTLIQSLYSTMGHAQRNNLLQVGALVSFSYRDVLAGMYKDTFKWVQQKTARKLIDFDQQLQGSGKNNGSEDTEKIYFKDLIGCTELEILAHKIASFMKHPERYERTQSELHRGILLYGPPQTGKTLFAKALRTLIEEELGADQKIHFINAKRYYDARYSIEEIFASAKYHAPCIIFFDEIDLIGAHRDKSPFNTSQLLTCMQGVDMTSKKVIVIGATNRLEQLDRALLVDGRFGLKIEVDYPIYEYRKKYLETQLAKRCIRLNADYIDHIAQETEGSSYNMLRRIITEALMLASMEERMVQSKDFESALDTEVRKIKPEKMLSEEERHIIATYQAGKAVIRYALKTVQQVVKITINSVAKEVKSTDVAIVIQNNDNKISDNDKLANAKKDTTLKLGEVFTKKPLNHNELISDQEQEKECLALLAGNIALEMFVGKSYSQCNKHDRAEAIQMIYNIIGYGEKIDDALKAKALEIKAQYEQQIRTILENNTKLLNIIVEALMKQTTIDRYQWQEIIKSIEQ